MVVRREQADFVQHPSERAGGVRPAGETEQTYLLAGLVYEWECEVVHARERKEGSGRVNIGRGMEGRAISQFCIRNSYPPEEMRNSAQAQGRGRGVWVK